MDLSPSPLSTPSYVDALNERQREAVLCTEGPLMVLAGAGSGKTKMLTSRIAYLIDRLHVPAYQILAVTFTNKAAQEMKTRIEGYLKESSHLGMPEIGTFHSVCVRWLRRVMPATPFTQPFVIYDDSDQLSLVKTVVARLEIDEKAFSPKSFQYAINRAKCDGTEPEEMQPAPHNLFERNLKRVYELYQKELFANNALDFGEIICMTYRILRDNAEIRRRFQSRYRYIHVDEYQDTNRVQYLLLSMLGGKSAGGHQNICVVGDEDQSIYKWRGADIRNILDFEIDFPGASVVKLEQNYRSTQSIINAAGHVIRNNTQRKDKTLWTDNEKGALINRVQLADERAEAELVVSEIKRLAESDGRAYGDFAILYRTHAQSRQFEDTLRREKIAYEIVGGLRFYDRKEIKDMLSYFKTILNPSDGVSLKRIINTPARGIGKTTIDKLEALQTQLALQGMHGVQGELGVSETQATFWTALRLASQDPSYTSAGTAKKLGAFLRQIEKWREECPRLLVSELYHRILDETGYVQELRKEGTEESLSRIENLEEFDTLLQEFEEDFFERRAEAGGVENPVDGEWVGGGSGEETVSDTASAAKSERVSDSDSVSLRRFLLPLFLEQSSLATDVDSSKAPALEGAAIQMMSLHGCKGLEFPVVFMVGMEEGLFPSVRVWEDSGEEEIEEERRLCYVGMTRAEKHLYMTHVQLRRLWGNTNYQQPARFFLEIPDEFVDFQDLSGRETARYSASGARSSGWSSSGGSERSHKVDESYSQRPGDSVTIGTLLKHPDYGMGKIVMCEGSGNDLKITIEFAGRDRRKFLYRFIRDLLEDG